MNESQLNEIINEIKDSKHIHNWDHKKIIKHIIYLVPEGQRFSQLDVENVIAKLELGNVNVIRILAELQMTDKVVASDFGQIQGMPYSYYMIRTAREQYRDELQHFGLGPEPECHSVSQRLIGLKDRITDKQQKVFFGETLNCLRIDANRAAIVMGWNLAFDHLRNWIFRKHLSQFNAELTRRLEKKNQNYDPVQNYEDFPHSEWLCLDVCEKAGLIDGHEKDILFESLKERNRFAHPSQMIATPAIAAGYVDNLLEHVVLSGKYSW